MSPRELAIVDEGRLTILRQAYGLFKPRSRFGPAVWPHHDILWFHSGAVRFRADGVGWEELTAPAGLWIPPETRFEGVAGRRLVVDSITHFAVSDDYWPGTVLMPDPPLRRGLQAMIELSQSYSTDGIGPEARTRLLSVILDAFCHSQETAQKADPVDVAWRQAEDRLAEVRGIADVAAMIGLSESAFRARHRQRHSASAGQHLIALRMQAAERALATTNLTVQTIARDVGYGHPESFFHAFRRHTGRTPTSFRNASSRFA